LNEGEMSEPVAGSRGVYVVQVQNRNEAAQLPDYTNQKQQQKQQTAARIPQQIYPSLKEGAKIDDRRAKFY
jgi:peptidylprolyl isomerase/peptidyl-prolyl cis-trans isomerase D